MRVRTALAALTITVAAAVPTSHAQVLPPPPPTPQPPEELAPLLEILAPVGGVVTEPGCATLGTILGLGAIVIPGLPGTIEAQTGLPLSELPIALHAEMLTFVNTLLYVQGSGCGLLPLAAERTVCASDDDLAAAAAQARDQLVVPGMPTQPSAFAPEPPPTAGAIVDTFRALAAAGVPGAADIVTALNNVGECSLRPRFTNVEPPAVPTAPAGPAPPSMAPTTTAGDTPPPTPSSLAPAAEPTPSSTAPLTPAATQAPATTGIFPGTIAALPEWLQWFLVVALIAFLYRDIAPRHEPTP